MVKSFAVAFSELTVPLTFISPAPALSSTTDASVTLLFNVIFLVVPAELFKLPCRIIELAAPEVRSIVPTPPLAIVTAASERSLVSRRPSLVALLTVTKLLKSFVANDDKSTSLFSAAALIVKLVAPLTTSFPVWVILPPDVNVRRPLIVDSPKTTAVESNNSTFPALVNMRLPLKLLFVFNKVMLPVAPVLNVLLPDTRRTST